MFVPPPAQLWIIMADETLWSKLLEGSNLPSLTTMVCSDPALPYTESLRLLLPIFFFFWWVGGGDLDSGLHLRWLTFRRSTASSPVLGDRSAAQLHQCGKQVHVAGGLVYLSATGDVPWPTQNSRYPDPSLPICGLPCCSDEEKRSHESIFNQATFQHGWSQSSAGLVTKGTNLHLRIGYLQTWKSIADSGSQTKLSLLFESSLLSPNRNITSNLHTVSLCLAASHKSLTTVCVADSLKTNQLNITLMKRKYCFFDSNVGLMIKTAS